MRYACSLTVQQATSQFFFFVYNIFNFITYFTTSLHDVRHLFNFYFSYRYLGSGCDQIDLHLTYIIVHMTIGKIFRRVCSAIWEVLRAESFSEMTEKRWLDIAEGFQNYSQYPLYLGTIDGKHVRVRKPKMSGSLF